MMAAGTVSRRQLLATAPALALAGCAARPGPMNATDTHPIGYPTVEAVRWFGERLAEESGDRLTIRQFPGGQLGEERDTLELTIFGGIDLNRINIGSLNSIAPETRVPTLPFLFRSTAHMRAALGGPAGDAILAALEPHGMIGLAFYDSGERGFYTMRRPVRAPADLRGQKIRVQNSDIYVAMIAALGGTATPMNFGEVYQALVQGVIDGAENNWPSFESSRHFEAARFYTPTAHVVAPEVLVMSRHRWRSLDAADQATVRRLARQSEQVMQTLWDAREASSRANLLAAGVTVVEDIDRAAFEALSRPIWDRFLTTPALRRLADDIRAVPG